MTHHPDDHSLHAQAQAVLRRLFDKLAESQRRPGWMDMQSELAGQLNLSPEAAERLLSELEATVGSLWGGRGPDHDARSAPAPDGGSTEEDDVDKPRPSGADLTRELAESASPAVDLLVRAVEARATDVHLDPHQDDIDVRFRIDGRLIHIGRLEHKAAAALLSQFKLMGDLDIAEPFRAKEGRLRLPPVLAGYEVRITTTRVVGGEAAALRLLDSRRLRRPLDSLGLSPTALALVQGMLRHGEGLILVTGPTNAGKTTTVYSMLHQLDNGERNIVTIEDPVEYEIPSFRQMGVDPRHQITMTSGLRTLLRMDPDVVLVGEIRDAETADIAMRAASSGKRVLSTFHTRDVASTVTALRDLKVDNRSLAGNLAGIVSQRLVRRVCQECCRIEPPSDEERAFFEQAGHDVPDEVPHAVGCQHCGGTGYFERSGVFEVAADVPSVSAAIAAGATEGELRTLLRRSDVPTLVDDALEKVRDRVTSLAEVQAMTWASVAPRHGGSTPVAAHDETSPGPLGPAPPDRESAYRVVIFAAPDDPFLLRDLLVRRLGMHPTDALIHAQRAPGILPERLTEDAARELAAAINEAGLHVEAVPEREIPDFEHAQVVHHARCLEAGFEIVELHGAEEILVPWSDIELVSVGQVPQEDDRHFIADDLITAARHTMPVEYTVTRLSGPELWLVRRNPLRAFRIDHKRMNYEYLGPRKTDSATHNFRLLLEELLRRAPAAYVTPATRAFVEHGPMRHYQFDSTDDLRHYTVFHLLIRLRAEQQAPAG